ncbi:MAG: superinfection immunity protein [Verrucomicrobiota bacterium]
MSHGKSNREAIPVWGLWVIGSVLGLIVVTVGVLTGILPRLAEAAGLFTRGASFLILLALAGILYFVPTLIARGTPRVVAIFAANLMFGWTGIGWALVLVWALAESGTMNNKLVP